MRIVKDLLRSSFVRDAFSLARGVFVAQVILLAAYPILTRIYDPEAFGRFGIIYSAALILVLFATAKIEMIICTVAKIRDAITLTALLLVCTGVVTVLLQVGIFLFDDQIAARLNLDRISAPYLHAIPAMVLAVAVYTGLRSWLIRRRRFSQIGMGNILRAPANLGVSIGAPKLIAAMGQGPGLIWGQLIGDGVMGAWFARHVPRREWAVLSRTRLHQMTATLRQHGSLLAVLFTSQTIATLHGRMPIFVIAAAYGTLEAGFYAFAERIIAAPFALLAVPISDVYRQRASRQFAAQGRFDDVFRRTLGLALAISVIPMILVALSLPYLVGWVFGAEWEGAVPTLLILLIAAGFSFNHTAIAYGSTIVSAKRFILGWHIFRLVGELVAAGFALAGLVSYLDYLAIAVGFRVVAYLIGIYCDYNFARNRTAEGAV